MNRPAVFFDRDNTLIACDGYLGDPAKVVLIDGAAEAIVRVRALGYAAVIFSNQSGVARGLFTEEAVHAVNHRLDDLLHEEDPRAIIDRHDFCPFHPTAKVQKYRVDSDLRKPKPGMIYQAQRALGLDLSRSWVIGDAPRDIAAGHTAGLRTVLLRIASLPPSPATNEGAGVEPDFVATSLAEAVAFIERYGLPASNESGETTSTEAPAPADEPATSTEQSVPGGGEDTAAEAPADQAVQSDTDTAADTAATPSADATLHAATADGQPTAAPVETPAAVTPADAEPGSSPNPADDAESTDAEPVSSATASATAESESESAFDAPASASNEESPLPESAPPTVVPAAARVEEDATRGLTEDQPDRTTEGPVKLTPRPTFKTEPKKQPETPAVKPAQGGIVVKPSQAPGMTWGERMRQAKTGPVSYPAPAPAATPAPVVAPTPPAPEPAGEEEADDADLPPPPAARFTPRVPVVRLVEPAPPQAEESDTAAEESAPEPAAGEPLRGRRREDESAQAVTVVRAEAAAAEEPAPRTRRVLIDTDGSPLAAGDNGRVEDLLEQILIELRRREEQNSLDFSVSKLLAGITQVLALAAMFFAYLNKDNANHLQATLLLAVTLQTLTISLLIMGRQK
jgi:D-glycero-D-manno-heptose 1,7-bisphosphate phosphatase